MNGTNLIRNERVRQVNEEGWTPVHDAQWRGGELVKAAICYALTAIQKRDHKIVCLCGSIRFWREFQRAGLKETMKGHIVLSIGAASGTDDEHFGNLPQEEYGRVKTMLDELHLRKIDMADEVLILDVGGYIGESTGRELMYAVEQGKEIRFLEPMAPKPGWALTPPDKEIPKDHKWQAFAYLEPGEGWFLNWDVLGVDGDPISDYCPEIEWPFPVNYARTEDFAALGFEIV